MQAYNLKGEAVEITATDLASRAWQHEIDHLHGVLFIDKMGTIAKLSSRTALKQFERDYEKAREKGEIPADDEDQRRTRRAGAIGLSCISFQLSVFQSKGAFHDMRLVMMGTGPSPSRRSRRCSRVRIPSSAW